MRYRALSPTGDYTFGQGQDNFLINSPACVAQAVLTGLKLWQGEWWLDTSAGVTWLTQVIGRNNSNLYDAAVQNQVLSTQGVTGIDNYTSTYNATARSLSISLLILTQFGSIALEATLPFEPPTSGYGAGGYGQNPYGA